MTGEAVTVITSSPERIVRVGGHLEAPERGWVEIQVVIFRPEGSNTVKVVRLSVSELRQVCNFIGLRIENSPAT